jgi:peptidoglycan/xylan/chitin deacetylase (PgdA/CDA1 family)
MPLDPSYLQYANRRYGMDHDRYQWDMLERRPALHWPDGKRLALWVNVAVQFFPLNQKGKPFPPPGGMTTAYPDLRHYTLRDYGNRVGIFRCLKALDEYDVKPTFAVSTQVGERYPYLLDRLKERGDEIICHGWNMDTLHYGGLDEAAEAEQMKRALDGLRGMTGQAVEGWLSPAKSQSPVTPDLLAEHGVKYMCDWINDELPFPFHTRAGDIIAMPLSTELDDRFIIQDNLHSESEYAEQIKDAFDFLYAESKELGGRMLALSIHPWMLGQPHRIGKLEEVLDYITGHKGVWSAAAGDICSAWQARQP